MGDGTKMPGIIFSLSSSTGFICQIMGVWAIFPVAFERAGWRVFFLKDGGASVLFILEQIKQKIPTKVDFAFFFHPPGTGGVQPAW